MKTKAVFLDRDGVLIEETGKIICKNEEMKIIPGVKTALNRLKRRGYLLIVVTNQAAVARGLLSEEGVVEMNKFLNKNLDNLIDAFYYCPHHPEMHPDVPEHARKYRITCNCRKPLPGMLIAAAKDYNIDLEKSYMIGDMISDIIAGKSAGTKTIMIESVNSKRIIASHIAMDKSTKADYYSRDLQEALKYVM
jgi:D-glycero-D-manno-heptose 1,7-bisphosphate phosphatase